ncbi:MAG: VOC family protein [Acidimicrobiia bacterium]|nr:VOC family protein [Acidimicrobiia bacterium]
MKPSERPVVTVTGLDHIVLRVTDAERSLAFYCETLGLAGDRVDEWRRGDVPFPSVRIDATTIIDLFPADRFPPADGKPVDPASGSLDHFCVTIEPTDLHALAGSGDVDVVRGPQDRLFGAQGYATSLYVADPDGNTVELRSY